MKEIMLWFKTSELWASIDAFFTLVSMSVTFGTLVMVVKNYYTNKKSLEKIEIYIHTPNKELYKLPTYIIRKNFTRAEVFGTLRALNIGDDFNIVYTSTTKFLEDIFKVQTLKSDRLIIEIDENDNFKWQNIVKG